jgi:hypothetical protein
VAATLAASACTDDDGPKASSTSTTPPVPVVVERTLPVAESMPSQWRLITTLKYGAAESQLGVDFKWGPEYGAPAPDGSWWMLDTSKSRIARFDHGGGFLSATPLRTGGVQIPYVLDDGTFWTSAGLGAGLVGTTDGVRQVTVPSIGWNYTDGRRMYSDDGKQTMTFEAGMPKVIAAGGLRTPSGKAFALHNRAEDGLDVSHAGKLWRLRFISPTSRRSLRPIFEFVADTADRLHFLVAGLDSDDSVFAGYLTIDSRGVVSATEPVRNSPGTKDPGSPSHLRVIPRTTSVSMMFVDDDAVRIYQRDYPERPFA